MMCCWLHAASSLKGPTVDPMHSGVRLILFFMMQLFTANSKQPVRGQKAIQMIVPCGLEYHVCLVINRCLLSFLCKCHEGVVARPAVQACRRELKIILHTGYVCHMVHSVLHLGSASSLCSSSAFIRSSSYCSAAVEVCQDPYHRGFMMSG